MPANANDRADDVEEALSWLRDRGWDVIVHEKNMRPEFERKGWRHAPSIDHTHWADLVSLRTADFVVEDYGSGMNSAEAILWAKRRYGSEQT